MSYPFLIHYWVVTEQYLIAGLYLAVVVLIIAGQNLYQGHKSLAISLALFSICICISLWFDTKMIIFLPPILIPLMLAYIFGKSLVSQQQAFITVMAQKLKSAPLCSKEIKYTRTITKVWLIFFIATVIEDILLAYLADITIWSYMTNFINYIFVAAIFVIEYVARRIVLSDLEHPSFIGFLKKMIYVQHLK